MTPRQFLDGFRPDRRLVTGGYYDQQPLTVESGDTVGVVLFNLGGPMGADDVAPFLYNLFMDPAIIDIPLPRALRDRLCRYIARKRALKVGKDYAQIGGSSPLNRHTSEQARAIERRLNDRFGPVTGATFRTYIAMRYWRPSSEEAAARMAADGVTKVVLLPLYPQYSKTTTGASLVYWKALEDAGEIPVWPTTLVYEFAAHPKYVQALSERIDEALQRFPRDVRDRAQLVFSAHGTPLVELLKRRDPYCCLIHSTVDEVMRQRAGHDPGRGYHVAFQSKVGPAKWLTPSTPAKLEALAEEGHSAVVVVPIAFVSDHIETAFELDIEVREEAGHFGIEHYEVTAGLNCHPLFIESLAECVAAQVRPAVLAGGDGVPDVLPEAIPALPRYKASDRAARCAVCPMVTEAHDWRGQPAVQTPLPDEVLLARGCAHPGDAAGAPAA